MKIFLWLRRESNFIFALTLLNFTVAAEYYFSFTQRKTAAIFIPCLLRAGFVLACVILLAGLLDLILRKKAINKIFKGVVLFLSVAMFFADIFTLYYYKCRVDKGMIDVILGTKAAEAGEFFDAYIMNPNFLLTMTLAVAGLLVAWFILVMLSRKNIAAVVILLAALIFGGIGAHERFPVRDYLSSVRLVSMLWGVRQENAAFEKIMSAGKKDAILTKNDSSIPNVVFILGESTSRNHMSLYGYELPTNPRLMQRKVNGEIFLFTDVIAPDAHTIPVMEKLFTFYRAGSEGDWFTYTNLFSILREAGYKTVWLSNQETFGKYSRAGRFYSQQGDISRFILARESYTVTENYDEKLLPLLDEFIYQASGKNFYVIHLLGTHSEYAIRYPSGYEKFSASDEKGFEETSDAQRQILAEYDNAILYNDFVVDEIISRFENANAIVIYVSDHGEEVYDFRDFYGHADQNISRYMIEVPMMIWCSEKFRASYPELCGRISDSVNKPFMTDDMIHVILDIMSIETEEYDAAKSVINGQFDSTRKRTYGGKIYDEDSR